MVADLEEVGNHVKKKVLVPQAPKTPPERGLVWGGRKTAFLVFLQYPDSRKILRNDIENKIEWPQVPQAPGRGEIRGGP